LLSNTITQKGVITYVPRNTQLNKEVTSLKLEANKLGYSIEVEKTIDSDSYILSNKKEERAVIIGRVEINGVFVISTFTINVYKWRWAEAEGFTKEQMIDLMGPEIFASIDLKFVSRYLAGEEI
tara:strand:- start:3934 stop:4305 length:372 start_codon:yes stop_codon:yes gene_type:complete